MSRKKAGGPGAILRDQVREDLLTAAEEVFAQDGMQAAKIGDIAKLVAITGCTGCGVGGGRHDALILRDHASISTWLVSRPSSSAISVSTPMAER